MTTRRMFGGALLATVLLLAGCAWMGDSESEPKTPEEHVRSAMKGLEANQSLKNVRTDLQSAIDELPNEGEKKGIREKLGEVLKSLPDNADETVKRKAIDALQPLALQLQSPSITGAPTERPWSQWLLTGAKILAAVAAAFLLVTAAVYVWKRTWRSFEINVARLVTGHIGSAQKTQPPDFTDKFTSLTASHKEVNNTLIDLQTEVRSLARLLRESLADRNDRRPTSLPATYPTYSDASPALKEPEFPVSVYDYLGKMSRFANAVKLDFQNGILVNDLEKKDELFLIRDSRESDDNRPLFLVPGAAQFHNKQDFEIYYAKYYECAKPAMGDVWIIGPALVEKVPGGWKLRDKGMLEVR